MIKSRFDGIAKLPEFLIIRCHRGTDGHLDKDGNWVVPYLKYQLKLERTLDMTEYAVNDTTRTKYVLRGIIKHRGESLNSGHYVAYTEGSGGNWWECNDENIKKIKFEDIEKTVGLTYVLFYQRLPETGDGG
jgi:ubiquitin carboxyl-terminal hydrolase 16/45